MTHANHPPQKIDFELLFLISVLKLKSLHYGYWQDDDELTLANLRIAQQRYTDTLIDLIPEKVSNILDVGCGIGDISATLAERGYKVTAISPDENHRKYLENRRDGNLIFYQTPFERFKSSEKFDLVLMSESQNYFDNDVGFQQAVAHLNKGGYLLVSGTFKKRETDLFRRVISIEDKYLERAKHYGLKLIRSINITDHVLPQSHFENKVYREHIEPLIEIAKDYLGRTMPLRLKLLKLLHRRAFNFLTEVYEDRTQRADPELFEQNLKYMRFLFSYY
ncbi:MAG: class I SAM-dependent methyltransferase [Candidatus Neomarinimicrobiota bacterium]